MSRSCHNVPIEQLSTVLAEALPQACPSPTEVSCDEALGRVLAIPLTAPFDLPPVAVSPMDGFAVVLPLSNDPYRVIGESVPGGGIPNTPQADQAVRVMTGGPVPPGPIGIIPCEQTDETADGLRLTDTRTVAPVPPGTRLTKGAILAEAGARLRPLHLSRLADMGLWRVTVFERPNVNLLAVGSELANRAPGHYDGNTPHLAALVRLAGGNPITLPPAEDRADAIREALDACRSELVITAGGTAKGLFDLTQTAAEQAGFELRVDGLDLRPGQSTRVACRGDQILVSLPGSPGAIPLLFEVLIRPILARLAGDSTCTEWWQGRLNEPYQRARPAPILSQANLALVDGVLSVTPTRGDGNGLLLLPQGEGPLESGTQVKVLATSGPPTLANP